MTTSKEPKPFSPNRSTLPDGTVRLSDDRCTFHFRSLQPGAVLVRVEGFDFGSLGNAPLDEITGEMSRFPPLELLIDASAVTGVVQSVADSWTAWLKANQPRLRRVAILVGDRYMNQTMGVAKLFSRTGELIQILSDKARFEQAVTRAASGSRG